MFAYCIITLFRAHTHGLLTINVASSSKEKDFFCVIAWQSNNNNNNRYRRVS